MEDTNREEQQKPHPRETATIFSKVLFCWILPFFFKQFGKETTEDDLYQTLRSHKSQILGDKLEAAWQKEVKNHPKPSLWRVLEKTFGVEFVTFGLLIFFSEVGLKLVYPLLVGRYVNFFSRDKHTTMKEAIIYGCLIVLILLVTLICFHNFMLGLQHLGMKVRIACCSLIYRKALRLSRGASIDMTVGQIINLLSNDVTRFDLVVIDLHFIWVAPVQTIACSFMLNYELGLIAISGISILVLFIPVQIILGKATSIFRMRTAIKTDERVRLMDAVISGIQTIKMYTWETPFVELVDQARKQEVKQIRSVSYIRAFNSSCSIILITLAVYICIVTYCVTTEEKLTAQYLYELQTFYYELRVSLAIFLPYAIVYLAETIVSVKRIYNFLMHDELMIESDDDNGTKSNKNGKISLNNVYAKWIRSHSEYTLKNVEFAVEPGQLVGIVGTVGAGKTTLLHVILKELVAISGTVEISGSISYASQEPWLFAGSIQQNILFGQVMNLDRYYEVIKVCCLERDFHLLPHGDYTIIGEKGVMLSGGQKARISLARAVYRDADIYLLDDPLSAVDTSVGKQLFDGCINGYLKNKCRVLITHQLQYLKSINRIYILKHGKMVASGSYRDIQEPLDEYVRTIENEEEEEEEEKEEVPSSIVPSMIPEDSFIEIHTKYESEATKEGKAVGKVSKAVYCNYLRACGNICCVLMVFLTFILTQISISGTEYFLKYWVDSDHDDKLSNTSKFLYICSGLVLFTVFITITRSMSYYTMCMEASRNLHNKMFSNIIHATMRFFNMNASGRILNRFSKDIGAVDEQLPLVAIDTLQIGLMTLGIVLLVSIVNPWNLIPTAVTLGIFYVFRMIFLSTSRDLKRLEGTTRSPVFSHLTASIQGLTTLRAFKAQNILTMEFDRHQDHHSTAFYLFIVGNRTFGFWLDIFCWLYSSINILHFLLTGFGSIGILEKRGGDVGLVITQTSLLVRMLQWGMRQWTELENTMTSVERILEYVHVPQEVDNESKKPPESWPKEGTILFQEVSLRYAPEDHLILKNLNFSIGSGEKIGIVGRTGAGKSSIISALFRLTDQISGEIVIDGVNTRDISLKSLRSSISIIPQEPVLFSGSIRKNLDPFDEYGDESLWNVLEEVELKEAVLELPLGLEDPVSEGGSNFSVGQRQLICLARAILHNNKVLVMDEATASIDPRTDALIQNTIRKKFKSCTVLTIAHRLNTILDSDKILVMDSGMAVEFDHPFVLLSGQGYFYDLMKRLGERAAEDAFKTAEEDYKRRQEESQDDL